MLYIIKLKQTKKIKPRSFKTDKLNNFLKT